MWNRNQAVSGLVLAVVGLAAACTDVPPTQPLTPEETSLFGSQALSASTRPRTLDDEFLRLAQEIPGFGGMFYDEAGDLNVYLARDRGQERVSVAHLMGHLSTQLQALGVNVPASQRLMVREGQYDFLALSSIHSRVSPVFGLAGVVFTDVDEARNRVTIGVENNAAASRVEHTLEMLGVDREAVHIALTEPIRPLVTLHDEVRPTAGGLQIWRFVPPGSAFICTLGFNVRSPTAPNVHGYVTNSHCTEQRGVVTGTQHAQKQLVLPFEPIATEAHDIPFFACADLFPGTPPDWRCRFSDAAGFRYLPGVPNAHGRIYRTQFPGTTAPGSLDIDEANPQWTIVQERPFPLVGDILHKTGRSTGWTMGPVTETCVNASVAGSDPLVIMLCQDIVEAASTSGDSGSPVFERIGETGNVRLVGILWGGSSNEFVFSAMSNVRFENQHPRHAWTTFPGQVPPPAP